MNEQLIEKARSLEPWHLDVRLSDSLSVSDLLGYTHRHRQKTGDVEFFSPRGFLTVFDALYPDGLSGKRMLDCACNNGAYCFLAAERDVKEAIGFDVRDHWIKQARFVQENTDQVGSSRLSFSVLDILDLPADGMGTFDLVFFKGIFYHLPDPIRVLENVASKCSDVLLFNTATRTGQPDGMLSCKIEGVSQVMSGVHHLSWYPSGPRVCAAILQWLGFKDIRLVFNRVPNFESSIGRLEILAARELGRLDCFEGQYEQLAMSNLGATLGVHR